MQHSAWDSNPLANFAVYYESEVSRKFFAQKWLKKWHFQKSSIFENRISIRISAHSNFFSNFSFNTFEFQCPKNPTI